MQVAVPVSKQEETGQRIEDPGHAGERKQWINLN